MKRLVTMFGALFVACAVLVQTSAFATSGTTALLGNTSVPRIPRAGIAGASLCPQGSFVVGARIWVDTFPRVTGFAAFCTNGASTPTLGALVGDTSDAVAVVAGQLANQIVQTHDKAPIQQLEASRVVDPVIDRTSAQLGFKEIGRRHR